MPSVALTYIAQGHCCFMPHPLVKENNHTKFEEDPSINTGGKSPERLCLQVPAVTLTYITEGHCCFMTHYLVTENNHTKCEENWSATKHAEGDRVWTVGNFHNF